MDLRDLSVSTILSMLAERDQTCANKMATRFESLLDDVVWMFNWKSCESEVFPMHHAGSIAEIFDYARRYQGLALPFDMVRIDVQNDAEFVGRATTFTGRYIFIPEHQVLIYKALSTYHVYYRNAESSIPALDTSRRIADLLPLNNHNGAVICIGSQDIDLQNDQAMCPELK